MHLYFSQKPIIINTMKFLQFDEMLALKQVLPANSKPAQQITSYIQLNGIYSKKLFSTYLSDLKLYAFEDGCPPSITKKANEINQSRALLNEWDDIIKSWGDVVSAGEEEIANKTLPYLLEILKEPYPFQIPISRMEFNYKLETSYQHFLIRPENTPYDTELPFVELYAKYINIKKNLGTAGLQIRINNQLILDALLNSATVKHTIYVSSSDISLINKQNIEFSGDDSAIRDDIASVFQGIILFAKKFEALINLFCKTNLEYIRHTQSSKQQINEYTKRWAAYTESIQHINAQFGWFNCLYKAVMNSTDQLNEYPCQNVWSIHEIMINSWKSNVQEPLIGSEKLHLLLVEMVNKSVINYIENSDSAKKKQNEKLSVLINLMLIDQCCDKSNIAFLGHSSKFKKNNIICESEDHLINLAVKYFDEIAHKSADLAQVFLTIFNYIEAITGVFPASAEISIQGGILQHLREHIKNIIQDICLGQLKGLLNSNRRAICTLMINEDLLQANDMSAIGGVVSQYVNEILINAEKVQLIPFQREYYVESILYFLKSTCNHIIEQWKLVNSAMQSLQHVNSIYDMELSYATQETEQSMDDMLDLDTCSVLFVPKRIEERAINNPLSA